MSDFVIGELFCNSLITLLCIVKEEPFEQTAFNNLLCTEVSSQLFYSSFIMFSPVNSLQNLKATLHFHTRTYEHTPFLVEEIHIS